MDQDQIMDDKVNQVNDFLRSSPKKQVNSTNKKNIKKKKNNF